MMTDGGESLPFDGQENELEDCSAGALRVALAHVNEMIQRADKVEDRLNMSEEKVAWAMGRPNGANGAIGKARSVMATLHNLREDIRDELDRRGEPRSK